MFLKVQMWRTALLGILSCFSAGPYLLVHVKKPVQFGDIFLFLSVDFFRNEIVLTKMLSNPWIAKSAAFIVLNA